MFVNIEAKPITFNKNLSFPTRRSKLKKIVRLSSEGAYVELTYLLAEIMESSSSSINRQMEEKRKRGKRFLTFNEGESLGFLKSTRVEDKRMRKKDFDSSVKSERNFLKIHFVHISRSSKKIVSKIRCFAIRKIDGWKPSIPYYGGYFAKCLVAKI